MIWSGEDLENNKGYPSYDTAMLNGLLSEDEMGKCTMTYIVVNVQDVK